MMVHMDSNVPQEQGKRSGLTPALTDLLGKAGEGTKGKEKFWMIQYFPGFPDLGMIEIGDV